MKLRPLLIGPAEIESLMSLKNHAEHHPLTSDQVLRTLKGLKRPIGDNPRHVRHIPFGYQVVYSVETQEAGLIRHCSISVSKIGKFPNLYAFNELIKTLGFASKFNSEGKFESDNPVSKMWIEDGRSINIVELIQ